MKFTSLTVLVALTVLGAASVSNVSALVPAHLDYLTNEELEAASASSASSNRLLGKTDPKLGKGIGFTGFIAEDDDMEVEVDDDDDEVDDMVSLADIPTTAVAAGVFNTLVTALSAANLVDALSGEGPFTVFAPTDDAFAALPEVLVTCLLKKDNVDALTSILTYHVISGSQVLSTMLEDGMTATTLQGEDVTIDLSDGDVKINDSEVIIADILTTNGVIHVIDAVLVPPSIDVGAFLKSCSSGSDNDDDDGEEAEDDEVVEDDDDEDVEDDDNMEVVEDDDDDEVDDEESDESELDIPSTAIAAGVFNTLVAALSAADLVDALSEPNGPYTVFAPTDNAFAALPEELVTCLLEPDNKGALSAVLTYHVVSGQVLSTDLVDGMMATTLQGEDVTVDLSSSDGDVKINDSEVVYADIITTNGVIHVIDSVLVPPSIDVAAFLKSCSSGSDNDDDKLWVGDGDDVDDDDDDDEEISSETEDIFTAASGGATSSEEKAKFLNFDLTDNGPIEFSQFSSDTCDPSTKLYSGEINSIKLLKFGEFCITDTIDLGDGETTTSYTKLINEDCSIFGVVDTFNDCTDEDCSDCNNNDNYKSITTWDQIFPNPFSEHCFQTSYASDGESFDNGTLNIDYQFTIDSTENGLEYKKFIVINSCIQDFVSSDNVSFTTDSITVTNDKDGTSATLSEDSLLLEGPAGSIIVTEGNDPNSDDDYLVNIISSMTESDGDDDGACLSIPEVLCSSEAAGNFTVVCDFWSDNNIEQLFDGQSLTIFAPVDSAFNSLFALLDETNTEVDEDTLGQIFLFHATIGMVTSSDLECGGLTEMIGGGSSRTQCSKDDNGIEYLIQKGGGNSKNNIEPIIIAADIIACDDSVVHVITEVMLPNFIDELM